MNKIIGSFMLILFLCSAVAFGQRVEDSAFDKKIDQLISYKVPVISVAQAHRWRSKYIFLDARSIEEYNISHIGSSIYVGYDDFDVKRISKISKDEPIIIYCSIGYRSDKIGGRLKQAGFTKIFNLYGSIFEWVNRGFPIINNEGESTNELHTYNQAWSKWVTNPSIEKIYDL